MLLAFIDTPQRNGRLSIFPVLAADEPSLSYLLMIDAIREGSLTIEGDGDGEDPHVIARNQGPHPVLILDCETLSSGKQRHSTNQSVLLGPKSVTKVPASCRYPGKWSCQDRGEAYSRDLESFPLLDGQVGILAFLGRQLLGLDALGSPELYSPLHRRLLSGYLITALASGEKAKSESEADQDDLGALARALEGAERIVSPSAGRGEYCTIRGDVTGGELRHNGHLVHLSVFPNGVSA